MAYIAIMAAECISIPIYHPTLGAESIHEILVHSESKAIIVGKLDDYSLQQSGIPDIPTISVSLYSIKEKHSWGQLLKETEIIAWLRQLLMASPHWVSGSNEAYNYNGIAYNRSDGVPPNNRDLYFDGQDWLSQHVQILPMDLRGIADISDTEKYLAGGMISNQTVSNKVYKLNWH